MVTVTVTVTVTVRVKVRVRVTVTVRVRVRVRIRDALASSTATRRGGGVEIDPGAVRPAEVHGRERSGGRERPAAVVHEPEQQPLDGRPLRLDVPGSLRLLGNAAAAVGIHRGPGAHPLDHRDDVGGYGALLRLQG